MRWPLAASMALLTIAVVALPAPQAWGARSFPYTAYITNKDVYVRSGPGQDYYPTDKLKTGDPVEVYRHDPGGWYAIRPPKGSFSWLSGRYLDFDRRSPKVPGLAKVKGDRVAARVGSRFNSVRDVIQVRLHDQEMVEVIEERSTGDQKWYKIVPPSGEFRWVFGKYVDPDYPANGLRKAPAGSSPLVQHRSKSTDLNPTGLDAAPEMADIEQLADTPPRDGREADEAEQTSWSDAPRTLREPAAARPLRSAVAQADDQRAAEQQPEEQRPGELPPLDAVADQTEELSDGTTVETAQYLAPSSASGGPAPRFRPTQSAPRVARVPVRDRTPVTSRVPDGPDESQVMRHLSPEEFEDEVQRLDLELATMVTEEPTAWTFGELRPQTEELLATAQTALERGRARLVLNKIARFEDIKQRFDSVNTMREQTEQSNQQLSALKPKVTAASAAEDDRFDGVGHLTRVASTRLGDPRYVLLDPNGQVACYVTPAPGLGLKHYLGHRIGVVGTRGFLAEQNAPHVMAKHVNVLDAVWR